jgi:prepilin-type N-terminal cleavage/methylation domain-containing protein/prepilin-type processing-associated H-X9-DG protein
MARSHARPRGNQKQNGKNMKRIAVIGTMTNNRSPAFTLIESLVVMATIGIMAAIAVPVFNGVAERAKSTKDLINLLHIGAATQMYMNDNNGVFPGSATLSWMSQLELNQKYLSTCRVLESPFDKRTTSELSDGSTAVSYAINANIFLPGNVAISADKITKPVTFIVFAPAQTSTATVTFVGKANDGAPGVTVVGDRPYPPPPPNDEVKVKGGTHGTGTKINAVFADWHVETMAWSGTGAAFKHTTKNPVPPDTSVWNDPDAPCRWSPDCASIP